MLTAPGLFPPAAYGSVEVQTGFVGLVPGPAIALHTPLDGRLDGDGFAFEISGYRFAYQVGLGASTKDAAPGQVLLVFSLAGTGTSVQADLVVDGEAEPLPSSRTANASAPAYYLASVPVGANDVALEASADGFSQMFIFTKGRREGPQPVVLYRGRSQWEQVDPITRRITSIPTPDSNPSDLVPGSVLNVKITAASLTYFLPGSQATPGDPSKAWLVMSGSALPAGGSGGHQLQYQHTLTGSAVTLTLPSQKPMAARITGQGGPTDESGQWGLFAGDYYREVPATLISGTITVSLPPSSWLEPVITATTTAGYMASR